MFDDLFSFVDPLFDPSEADWLHFMEEVNQFIALMEEQGHLPAPVPLPLTEETYKQMWMLRYQQHMGQMTFMELLDKYEEILGIPPRSASEQ